MWYTDKLLEALTHACSGFKSLVSERKKCHMPHAAWYNLILQFPLLYVIIIISAYYIVDGICMITAMVYYT